MIRDFYISVKHKNGFNYNDGYSLQFTSISFGESESLDFEKYEDAMYCIHVFYKFISGKNLHKEPKRINAFFGL